MPLGHRPRPTVVPARRDFAQTPGKLYVQDVYLGTHMEGVRRGSVKWLRVVESPEKRFWTKPAWNGQGQEAPAMNWHDFNNKRILGTVPVEADGSAYFEVPPDRFVYFQLLDQQGMMVQSMRSGLVVQSGETSSCLGCHEDRRQAPRAPASAPLALLRQATPLQGWLGAAREFNYLAEVQPVFDRHCVSCHDYGSEPGRKLNLARDRDLVFNTSYNELWRKKWLKVVGAGPADTQAPCSWGSHASPLVKRLLNDQRCRASLNPEEFERIVTWIDLNAPYYPTYASAYPDNLGGRSPLADAQLQRLEQLTGVPVRQLASHSNNQGPQVSFDRPELSPCLAGAVSEAAREEALAIIRSGQRQLAAKPEADMPGFEPCAMDNWRNEKYLARQQTEFTTRQALESGKKVYERLSGPPGK